MVPVGTTAKIQAGTVHDYESIDVEGTLEIQPGSSGGAAWTILGSSGDVTINGAIVAECGQHTGGTLLADGGVAPFLANEPAADGTLTGPTLAWTIVQAQGGTGASTGFGPADSNCSPPVNWFESGGPQAAGNGGGGSGSTLRDYSSAQWSCDPNGCSTTWGQMGGTATPTSGGTGGDGWGMQNEQGTGATAYGANAADAGVGNCSPWCSAGGAGGGFRGAHGGLLFMKVLGVLSGTGTIDVGGQSGGGGGAGGGGLPHTNQGTSCGTGVRFETGGGAGGGGAGGSGGSFVLRYNGSRGIALLQPASSGSGVRVAGGAGGAAGNFGTSYQAIPAQAGADGASGNLSILGF